MREMDRNGDKSMGLKLSSLDHCTGTLAYDRDENNPNILRWNYV